MTKADAKLHPGEFFIFKRYKDGGNWERLFRDNDAEVMRTRYEFQKSCLRKGEAVRLYAPDCALLEEASCGDTLPLEHSVA